MKLAFLSPFTSSVLKQYIPELNFPEIPQGMGGSAVFELVKGLIEEGIELHLITLQPGLNNILEFHNKNINYYLVPRRLKGSTRDFWKEERSLIKNVLEKINPEVIHANWTYEYALAALDFDTNRTLITAHDIPYSVLKYSGNLFYIPQFISSHIVYRKTKWISFVSNAVLSYAKPFLKKDAKYFVIPNIIDLSEYDLEAIDNLHLPKNYFVSIGLWGRLKNIKAGLKSFNRFLKENNNKNIYYVLVGPGLGTNDESYKWAKKNNLDKNVLFLGKHSREDTLGILKSAKALLHLSKTEAFPMVVGEAMYLNVPVIGGKNSDGVPEILGNGEYGLICDISSIKEIVTKMHLVINYNKDIALIVKSAKEKIVEYRVDTVVKKYLFVYKDMYNHLFY